MNRAGEKNPYLRLGGGQKGDFQIWLSTFVTAYREFRIKLTKNWLHTFPL